MLFRRTAAAAASIRAEMAERRAADMNMHRKISILCGSIPDLSVLVPPPQPSAWVDCKGHK